MAQKRKVCSIILAAGKGTRIGLTSTHKTCLPVGGRPVIVRTIEAFEAAGISPQVIVVGKGAQHVMKTVGSVLSDVFFAYQPEALGTGNAARCGANLLKCTGYVGDVLITAGDKLIDVKVVKKLLRKFSSSGLDALFLVGRREDSPTSGRVIFDRENRPVCIVEMADIRRARVFSQIIMRAEEGRATPEFVAKAIASSGMHQHKARLAFQELHDFAEGTARISQDKLKDLIPKQMLSFKVHWGKKTRSMSPEDIEPAEYVNLSVYLLTADSLEFAVGRIKAENAQNEEYLTDIVDILAGARHKDRPRFKLGTMCVEDPHLVMGFNNLEELRAMEEYVRGKEGWA